MRRKLTGVMAAGLWIVLSGCGADGSGAGDTDGGSSGAVDTSEATGTAGSSEGSGSEESGSSGGSTSAADSTAGEESSSGGEDACATDVQPSDTVVLTSHGPIEGIETEEGVAFLGLPYAAPPLGELRWAAPQEPTCWTETLDATEIGPVCTQLDTPTGPVVGEEDCLQLNVWTPAADDGGRPVMVFVHGGGNSKGSGTYPIYEGARLAAAGDQVVITINYRLGVLGWLTHPDLPAVNFGLRDQIAALQWVQANAAAFGGDPERVTVFGESAGAVNTCTLLGAPDAAGLFRGAIVQSGTCTQRAADVYAEQMSTPFLGNSGCAGEDDVLACLRALDDDALVAIEPTGYPSVGGFAGQGWGPSLDPDSLPVQTIDAMAAGTHNDVPLIIGANAEETWQDTPEIADEAAYVALVEATLGPLAGPVLDQYPVSDYASPRDAYVAVTSDARFVCNARRAARAASNGRSPVYRYHFAHDDYFAPGGGDTGAFHGLELQYIFGNFDAIIPGFEYPTTDADEVVRDAMQAIWSSFAAGTLQSDPAWPVYEGESDPYLLIESPLDTGEGVRTEQCDFWAQFTGG